MPKLATADFFRERKLQPGEIMSPPEKGGLKGMVPVAGLMPALVPGMVDAVPGGAARVRHEIVRRSGRSRRSSWRTAWPSTRCAPGASIAAAASSISGRPPNASSCRTAAPHGRARSSASRIWRAPCARWWKPRKRALAAGATRVAAIDAVRDYLLSRRDRAQHRRLQPRPPRAAPLRRHGRLPAAAGRRRFHDVPAASKFTSPASGARDRRMIEALNMLEVVRSAGHAAKLRRVSSTRWSKR